MSQIIEFDFAEFLCEVNFDSAGTLLYWLNKDEDCNKIGEKINAFPIKISNVYKFGDTDYIFIYDSLRNIIYRLNQISYYKIEIKRLKNQHLGSAITFVDFYENVPFQEIYLNEHRSISFNKYGKIYYCTLLISDSEDGKFSWKGKGYSMQEAFICAYGNMRKFTTGL